jgi:hypothetical protein
MGAGFQGNEDIGATRPFTGHAQRMRFRMGSPRLPMPTLADNFVV